MTSGTLSCNHSNIDCHVGNLLIVITVVVDVVVAAVVVLQQATTEHNRITASRQTDSHGTVLR